MNILKRFERYVSAIFKLGKTERRAKAAEALSQNVPDIQNRVDHLAHIFAEHERRLPQLVETYVRPALSDLSGRHSELARGYSDLTRRLDRLVEKASIPPENVEQRSSHADVALSAASGFEAFQQSFYHRLENEYRGPTADIRKKLRVHLPDVEAAFLRTKEKPALDLGCGRGEWLDLLQNLDIPALGIDTNAYQVEEALRANLNVQISDAIQVLKEADSSSYSAITAFHLIEHLPFESVLWIAREAMRVLAPGGVLLFETPNVRNMLVGSTSFHNDPTHLRPLTDPILKVLFETCGYTEIDVRFLNPHERLDEFRRRPNLDDEIVHLMFGPQDLAVIGRKPIEEY